MDDIFEAFKTYQKYYILLYDHFFLHISWYRLELILSKLKISLTKIYALEEEHTIKKRIRLKLNKFEKIMIWPILQDETMVRLFAKTI